MSESPRVRTRAIRGAVDAKDDTPEAIREAVTRLLREIVLRNALDVDDVVSAIFTATPDLVSVFPALPAREVGWGDVPLLCATEIGVPGSLPRCIRVLVTIERADRGDVAHVYLGAAAGLRPDLHRGDRTQ